MGYRVQCELVGDHSGGGPYKLGSLIMQEVHLFDVCEKRAHAEAIVQVAEHVLPEEVAGTVGLHNLLERPHVRTG